MNIGILTTYLALGDETDSGIGQHYRILADALSAEGHDVHVVYCADDGAVARADLAILNPPWTCDVVSATPPSWLSRLVRRSWPLQVLLNNLWMAWAADRVLAAAGRTRELAVIETHAYKAPSLFFLCRRDRPPVVTRVSTTTQQIVALSTLRSRVLRWQGTLEKNVTCRSDALVTHTRLHRDTVCALEGHAPARFAIVPHGLPDPGESPACTAADAGPVEFLFVGRFEERKGIDMLLAAIPVVARVCPDTRFTLAGSRGDGRDWEKFTASHPSLLAESRVESLGRVSAETLRGLYRRCAVMVAPSRYESFGLIYAEAMSYAKPVIGCTTGGVPEVVTPGSTGLLAAPGDVASLAECMIHLATNANLRARMGRAARADFLARFSARTLAFNSVALYQQIVCLPNQPEP